MELLDYQKQALTFINDKDKAMLALDMGLGKTYTGLHWHKNKPVEHTIILCQATKIDDWYNECQNVLTDEYSVVKIYSFKDLKDFLKRESGAIEFPNSSAILLIMSYGIFTNACKNNPYWFATTRTWALIIDESQVLKGPKSQISKFILKFKNYCSRILLLSGDPISTAYKDLYVQMRVLGLFNDKYGWWDFERDYCNILTVPRTNIKMITGYKNTERLLALLASVAFFLKSSDAIELPQQIFQTVEVEKAPEYNEMMNERLITIDDNTIVSDTPLKLLLNLREITSGFLYDEKHNSYVLNSFKVDATKKILEEFESENFVIFYNFTNEFEVLKKMIQKLGKTVLCINGSKNDWLGLNTVNEHSNTVILIHFQSGARGIDRLQFNFNKQIYFSLPLSGELYKQSLKRIHRLKQTKDCYYWTLLMNDTIDDKILNKLKKSQTYTLNMFESNIG